MRDGSLLLVQVQRLDPGAVLGSVDRFAQMRLALVDLLLAPL